jgi:hypothetical protein
VIVCAVLVLLRRKAMAIPAGSARQYWWSVLVFVGFITVVRIGICWWATYRAFIHRESLSAVPLIALLMPEYLLTPGDPATPTGTWALTAALVIGTFVAVSLLALFIWRCGRRA